MIYVTDRQSNKCEVIFFLIQIRREFIVMLLVYPFPPAALSFTPTQKYLPWLLLEALGPENHKPPSLGIFVPKLDNHHQLLLQVYAYIFLQNYGQSVTFLWYTLESIVLFTQRSNLFSSLNPIPTKLLWLNYKYSICDGTTCGGVNER